MYKKQFIFQQKHLTKLAIFQLIDQMSNDLEKKNQFYLDISIDLSNNFCVSEISLK